MFFSAFVYAHLDWLEAIIEKSKFPIITNQEVHGRLKRFYSIVEEKAWEKAKFYTIVVRCFVCGGS
jgi:hypothetical protein